MTTNDQLSDEQVQAAVAADRASRAAAGGWQPIETAPKDGTVVLLGRHMDGFGFIRGYGRYESRPGVLASGTGAFVSGWISSGFDRVMSNLGLAHPTHWMPLPAAPDAALRAAGEEPK